MLNLKLGLYFGGKFCVYYLDKDNHLYEYHAPDINTAGKLVSDFFDHTLDLTVFEKHFFNIGNQPHFITKSFEYQKSEGSITISIVLLIIYSAFALVFLVGSGPMGAFIVLPAIIFLFILGLLIKGLLRNSKMKGQYLQISRGNNQFYFGENELNAVVYDKKNIKEIVHCLNWSYNNRRGGDNFKILFKNGDNIIIDPYLIDGLDFLNKFPDNLNIPVTLERKSLFQ